MDVQHLNLNYTANRFSEYGIHTHHEGGGVTWYC